MPMLANRIDEAVGRRACVGCGDQPGISLSVGQRRRDAAGGQQLLAGAQGEDRLAMPVLVLDELQRPPVSQQCVNRLRAVR